MPDVKQLFDDLERVKVFNQRKSRGWNVEKIAELALREVSESGSCPAIVNTKVASSLTAGLESWPHLGSVENNRHIAIYLFGGWAYCYLLTCATTRFQQWICFQITINGERHRKVISMTSWQSIIL